MKPTDEQLRDPKWWDENFSTNVEQIAVIVDARGGVNHVIPLVNAESSSEIFPTNPDHDVELYSRPTSQPTDKPDWNGEGFEVVEAELHEGENCWYEAVVIGKTVDGRRQVVQWVDDAMAKNSVSALPFNRVRPLRTPEQREREELAKLCDDHIRHDDYGHNLADAIIAAGWRKPGGQ